MRSQLVDFAAGSGMKLLLQDVIGVISKREIVKRTTGGMV